MDFDAFGDVFQSQGLEVSKPFREKIVLELYNFFGNESQS